MNRRWLFVAFLIGMAGALASVYQGNIDHCFGIVDFATVDGEVAHHRACGHDILAFLVSLALILVPIACFIILWLRRRLAKLV